MAKTLLDALLAGIAGGAATWLTGWIIPALGAGLSSISLLAGGFLVSFLTALFFGMLTSGSKRDDSEH